MTLQPANRGLRRGMTLIELLMVISIMTLLMAVAIPMVRPAFQNRRLREATRQVNAFFAGAEARAAEAGRAVGVWIEASDGGGYATELYLAEVSPPFTGASLGSRVTVETNGQLHFWDATGINADPTSQAYLQKLVPTNTRCQIRFDHKGPSYNCLNNGSAFVITSLPNGVPPGTEHPGVRPPAGLTYEILRSPSKSAVSPLTLPGDTVIDLMVSGIGLGVETNLFATANPNSPVVVMFTPEGQIQLVYVNYVEDLPIGSVYLMIGRRAKVTAPTNPADFANPELSNVADPTNLWVTVNNRTGAITTDDNAATNWMPTSATVLERVKGAREFARASNQKGGR